MSIDISGLGLQSQFFFSKTYANIPFTVTAYAKDVDPLATENLTIATVETGLNGDAINYRQSNPISVTFALIPNSEDELKISIAFQNNITSAFKRGVNDVIKVVHTFQNGLVDILTGGTFVSGSPTHSISSSQRIATKTYTIAFAASESIRIRNG